MLQITTSSTRLKGEVSDADRSQISYAAGVFVAGLLLLERSADQFIDQVALLARTLSVSPTLIAMVTAGAEWEELAVVAASLAHGASSLAIGNVVGSGISNILGAFSLGLIFSSTHVSFDHSAKRFAVIQLAITSLAIVLLLLIQLQHDHGKVSSIALADSDPRPSTRGPAGTRNVFEHVVGVSLVIVFVLYLIGVSWAIGRGMLDAPEDSDSDSDGDSDSSSASDRADDQSDTASTRTLASESDGSSLLPPPKSRLRSAKQSNRAATSASAAAETTPLLLGRATSNNMAIRARTKKRRTASRALRKLVFALLVLSLCGFLLSRSTLELADALGISDTVLGLTLLSFATTLPEKLLSVVAGRKMAAQTQHRERRPSVARPSVQRQGASGWLEEDAGRQEEATGASAVLMAGAAGSNVFLLTLCLGISLLFDRNGSSLPTIPITAAQRDPIVSAGNVRLEELALLELSSSALVVIAYSGGRRWHGFVLLALYVAFLIAEFTVYRR